MAARPLLVNSGSNGRNLFTHVGGGPTSVQQDPGLYGTSQDPGPSFHPQHHISARPVLHALPPPHFLHCQWPMPFSYSPFGGFPGMGYGMVMPSFPPPYMQAPAYILPHPHIQPVDYRRLLHPQVHVPNAPYQNLNQTCRIHPPHAGHVRETVNSEVQTEPTQIDVCGYGEESPPVSSDSARGSASNSPSSSSLSSQKLGSAEVENYTLPSSNAKDTMVKRSSTSRTVKHGFKVLHPTETKTVQSCVRAALETQSWKDGVCQENNSPCRNNDFHFWSVSSPDGIDPVCSSSQQEEEVVKERRVSVPDILMSWGGGTPQATMLKMADKLLENDHQLPSYGTEVEDKSVYQSQTETRNDPVVADGAYAHDDAEGNLSYKDSATLFKILKLRKGHEERKAESRRENEPVGLVGSIRHLPYRDELLHSLNKSQKLPENEQEDGNKTNPHEDTTEIIPYQMFLNNCQMKRKINESVWSVESLPLFIPTKEWLLNSMFEPEITDPVPVSDSWLVFSTPAEKFSPPKEEREIDASEMRRPKRGQSKAPSENDHFASPTHLQSKLNLTTLTEEDMDTNRSSEPEANQSPNQELLVVNEQQKKGPCSSVQAETLLFHSAAGENISTGQLIHQNGADTEVGDGVCGKEVNLRNKADEKMAEVSPSKGRLVECGIQCTELKCACEEMSSMGPRRRHPFKYSDMKKANDGQAEGFSMMEYEPKNQKRNGNRRNRGQVGGNGRNPPH
ncbi:uncharacterized protein LOC116066492 isoform X2 [Sander lucioperca]|uniref:uncharacterized protein LOC116066492 isoform X2 n=1 Tax=Sander lucioperca TaxID=283035 RepID=UPI00165393F1|nr:uncharacterized protein LOC116066492 isoform X2 [Sander lucioperca]